MAVYRAWQKFDPVINRSEFSAPAFLIIAAGVVAVLAGIFGCVGSLTFSRRLLIIYFLMMVTVWALKVISAVICFLSYDMAPVTISRMINNTICAHYWTSADFASTMDTLQTELSCCGGQDFEDWIRSPRAISLADPGSGKILQVPVSCCLYNITQCHYVDSMGQPMFPELFRRSGCSLKLVDRTRRILVIAGWMATGTAGTMLLGMSAVCCFAKSLKDFFS